MHSFEQKFLKEKRIFRAGSSYSNNSKQNWFFYTERSVLCYRTQVYFVRSFVFCLVQLAFRFNSSFKWVALVNFLSSSRAERKRKKKPHSRKQWSLVRPCFDFASAAQLVRLACRHVDSWPAGAKSDWIQSIIDKKTVSWVPSNWSRTEDSLILTRYIQCFVAFYVVYVRAMCSTSLAYLRITTEMLLKLKPFPAKFLNVLSISFLCSDR